MFKEYADPFNPWSTARAATDYFLHTWQQTFLTWDVLRIAWLEAMAEVVRQNRRPAPRHDPLPRVERGSSRRIEQSRDVYRAAYDDSAWLARVVRESSCA